MLLCTVAGVCEWRAMGMWALPQVGVTALGVQTSSARESMSGLLFRPVCVHMPGVQAAQLDGGGRAQVAPQLGLADRCNGDWPHPILVPQPVVCATQLLHGGAWAMRRWRRAWAC